MGIIDTSNIDATKPDDSDLQTQDLRDNFSAINTAFADANTRTVANKAAAVLLTPVADAMLFVNGSDGGWFKGVTGSSGYSDNGGSYCGTQFIPTGGDGSAAWVRVDGGYNTGLPYSAAWWGANGSASVAVNTLSIQSAIDYASTVNGKLTGQDGENYGISSLRIKNGLREFDFRSSIITPDSSTAGVTTGALQLDGNGQFGSGAGTYVDNCKISVEMDMQNGGRCAVYSDGCTNCVFEDNKIYGFTNHATINHYGLFFWYGSSNNKVIKNHISGYDNPTQRGLLVDFVGEGSSFGGYFSGSGAITRATNPCVNNIVTNNTLIDGSYAVNLIQAEKTVVAANVCKGQNHRSIYLASASWWNIIEDNLCLDFTSSAVVLGYGSCHNIVSGNNCKNEGVIEGEATIQANTGSSDNIISNNKVNSAMSYGVYIAIDAQRNIVDGNDIRNFYKAGIAVENDWEATLPTNAFYSKTSFASPTEGSSWSFNDTSDNVIQNNIIHHAQATRNVCSIYVAQIETTDSTAVTGTIIKNNTTLSGDNLAYNIFIYAEVEASLSGLKIVGNNMHSGNTCAAYTTTGTMTWNDKIDYWEGNEQLDELLIVEAIDFADADLTPSVITNTNVNTDRMFQFNNTGATSVTDFDDGFDGQQILLRGDTNTTIVYTSGLIRPKGLVNVTGMNANSLIGFKLIGTVWYETFRNF